MLGHKKQASIIDPEAHHLLMPQIPRLKMACNAKRKIILELVAKQKPTSTALEHEASSNYTFSQF